MSIRNRESWTVWWKRSVWFQPLLAPVQDLFLISSRPCSKYLSLPTLLLSRPLTWPDLPWFSAQGQPTLQGRRPCNSQPSRMPAREVLIFVSPISRREAEKRLNTLSVQSWIRMVRLGDTLHRDREKERWRKRWGLREGQGKISSLYGSVTLHADPELKWTKVMFDQSVTKHQ